MEWRALRLWDEKNSGSEERKAYWSAKMEEGSVRYVWRAQEDEGGAEDGGFRDVGNVMRRVGWRPVGWSTEMV